MRALIVLVVCVFALASPAWADCWPYCDQRAPEGQIYQPDSQVYHPQTYDPYGSQIYQPIYRPYESPQYPKEPTLGDPRPYRETDPQACTSLLCD